MNIELVDQPTENAPISLLEKCRAAAAEKGYPEDSEFRAHLYRNTANNRRELVDTYDDIPEIEDVAERHGGGKYSLIVNVFLPDGGRQIIKNLSFMVAAGYGGGRQNPQPAAAPVIVQAPAEPQTLGNQLGDLVQLLEAVKTILPAPVAPPQSSLVQEFAILPQLLKMFSVTMAESMNNQMEMMHRFTAQRAAQLGYVTPENEEAAMTTQPQNPLVATLLPLVEQYLPMILNKVTAPHTAAIAQQAPEYQALQNDPAAKNELIDILIQKIGAEAVATVREVLSI